MKKRTLNLLKKTEGLIKKYIEDKDFNDHGNLHFSLLQLRREIEETKGREQATPYDLLKQGGSWLGALRERIKWIPGGDRVTWSSHEDRLTLSIHQIEELAAHAVSADRREE